MSEIQTECVQGKFEDITSMKNETKHYEDELDRLIGEAVRQEEDGSLEEWQALTHVFKAFVGTGILGLPSAVMHGGIIAGPIILVVFGFICMYNIKLLVDTAKNIREGLSISRISYSCIAEHLFSSYGKNTGRFAKVVTDLLLCSLQLGFCCVYFVFIAHNIQIVVGKHDVRLWMVVALPFILLPSLITNIGRLAYFTTVGNMIILVGLGVIYHYLFTHITNPVFLPQFNGFMNFCVSFGQVVYAFEGIAVILPTENKLRRRDSFKWLIKIAASLVLVLYVAMGIFGYLAFGADTLGSITLNLPQTRLYKTLQVFFAIMVYFTYPLQLLVSVDIIKYYIGTKEGSNHAGVQLKIEMTIRAILVVLTCVLAICIPQLDNFMALVGSVSGVAVGVILPPILHSLCFWNQGLNQVQFVTNVFIALLGGFAFLAGTSATLYSIFHRFINNPEATKFLVQK